MSTMSLFRQLVPGLSPGPRFNRKLDHVGFIVDQVEQGHVYLKVLQFSPVSVVSPTLHIHLSITDAMFQLNASYY
jgi:hypothetical protein